MKSSKMVPRTSDESDKHLVLCPFRLLYVHMYVVTISPPDTLVSTQTEERCEEPAEGDAEPTSTPRLIRAIGHYRGEFSAEI